ERDIMRPIRIRLIDDPKFEVAVSSDFGQGKFVDDHRLLKLEQNVIGLSARFTVINFALVARAIPFKGIGDSQSPLLVLVEPGCSIGSEGSITIGEVRAAVEVVAADGKVNHISVGAIGSR